MIMLDFLRKLLGGGGSSTGDPHGLFFYVQCQRCGATVRLHVHKLHDLNREDDRFVWRKTIVDSRCFKPIPTTVTFDSRYQIMHQEIDGGRYITAEEFARLKSREQSTTGDDKPTPNG
jgi:hypothetical protein